MDHSPSACRFATPEDLYRSLPLLPSAHDVPPYGACYFTDVKDLDERFSAANLTTDENQQDQKPSSSAAAPENKPTAGSQNQAQEDKNTGDVFRLTDSFQMHKVKPLNKRQTIFQGEQISTVTPAQQLVVKLKPYDEEDKQEAKLLLKLKRHPNVVSIDHSGVCHQGLMTFIYIAMELCHEQNLHDHVTENVKNNVPFDSQLSISQAKQLVGGLNFIHENDVVHRDLKPHNVLFSLDKKTLKIADFGISKPMTRGRTVTNVTNARAGTDGYRAPETYNSNEISKQADIFSLGLVFYFLWSNGHHAFGDDPDDWNSSIKKNRNRDLSQLLLGDQEMAMDVLQWSLQFNRKERPKAAQILNHKIFGGTEISPKQRNSPKGAATTTTRRAKIVDNKTERPEPRSSQPKARNDNFELDLEKMIALQGKAELYMKHFEYQSAYKILKELQDLQGDSWKQFETLQQIIECLIMTDQPCDQEMNEIISTCQYLRLSPRDVHSTAEKYFEDDNFVRSYIMFHCAGKMHKTGGEVEVLSAITKCASRMDDILKKLIKKPRYRRVATSYIIPAMKEMLKDLREMDYDRTEENIVHEAECLHFVGSGYHEINDYGTALKYFKKGIQLLRDLGQEAYKYRLFSALLNNTGSSNFYLGRASEALPYHQEAANVVEYAEDFPNEEQKQKSIAGIEHNLQTCMRSGKRIDQPTTMERDYPPYGGTSSSYSSYKSHQHTPTATSSSDTNTLKDKSQQDMEQGEHLSACDTLQKLIKQQKDPWEQLETWQQIAECHVTLDQSCVNDINNIISTCQSLRLSPKDMEAIAGKHEKESHIIRAYVMYVSTCKMHKSSSAPNDAVRGIKECFLRMRQIVRKLAKKPRQHRIASGYIISSMNDIMHELHDINATSQTKAKAEAGCLNDIGVSQNELVEYKKALETYQKGLELMQNEFGTDSSKYNVYGGLLNNIGVSHQMLKDNATAANYFKQAIEAKERAQDYRDSTVKKKSIELTKNKLKACQSPSMMDESEMTETMMSLRDKSKLYLKHNEYSLACETLQQLIQLQVNPDEKLELLQQIAECQVMCGQPCDKEINTIITLCKTLRISANDLKPSAQEHFTESRLVHAYVMFVCISKIYKTDEEPSDSLEGMRESVQVLRHVIEKMVKQPRLRRIVSSHVVPSMHEMLADIRKINNVSTDEKVENEALALNAIAFGIDDVEEHEKAVQLYMEGMKLMEREFKANVTKCHVYGALLHNIGTSKCHQRKFAEAEKYYIRAIEAKQSALDFKSEEKKQSDVEDAKGSLARCRTLMKKFHQASEPKHQSSFQSEEIRDEHISQIALSNLSGGNMNSPTQRERAESTSSIEEQALVPLSSQLATSGNEAGGQQTMMPVDISDGRFENAQLGGHRTYNMTKKENISGDIQYGTRKINVHNHYYGPVEITGGHHEQAQIGGERSYNLKKEVLVSGDVHTGTRDKAVHTISSTGSSTTEPTTVEDETKAQAMFRLSDTIHMNKEKPLNPRKTIFYGEQISSVTPAQPLAIKLIPYEEANKKEANLLLSLERHPNVISFIHSGVCHQGPLSSIYIAMDLCHEKNLHDHVHENKSGNALFDPKQSISQAKQIIEGLKHIHKSKIVHRDLKPQNILLSHDRNNVIIADFGISKPMTSGRTNTDVTNSRAGTDGFRAPETYNSDVISRKADIFSLGLVLYFLWSNGHHAYGDDPDDWNSNIKRNRDRDLSHLLVPDKEIAIDLLEWILQYQPGDRPTAAQILNHRMFGGSELAPNQKTQPKDEKERSTEGQPASIPLMTNNKAKDEPSNVEDKVEQQLKDGDYRSARETLQNLQAIQQHPTDKLGTLKEIIECQLLTNQPHIDEINEITSICRSIGRSPDDMRSAGDQHFRDSLPVHAYIMYMCANKMYKTDSSPTDVVAGIRQCISCIGDCVARMVQQDHLRGLVSNRVIPSMREMLTGLSSKDVPGNEMVKNEAEELLRERRRRKSQGLMQQEETFNDAARPRRKKRAGRRHPQDEETTGGRRRQ